MTQDEVAMRLGISRTRVQQIERRAIAKLARALGFETPGGPLRVGRQRRQADRPQDHTCRSCGKRGHNARSCGRKPVRR